MKAILFLACLLLACLHAQAQNKKAIDSLMRVYNTAKHDTSRIMVLTSIAFEYRNSKPDTCISIAEKALQMSEKIGFDKGKGWALSRIGLGYAVQGTYSQSFTYYQESLSIFEKIQDKQDIPINLNNIGNIYYLQGKYPQSLEYFQQSLKIREEVGDIQGIAGTLVNIGNMYYYQQSYPQALEYYLKSLKIQEKIGDKQSMSYPSII